MISDLDKYGFIALAVVVALILSIAMSDLTDENNLGLNGIYFDDSMVEAGAQGPTDEKIVLWEEPAEEEGTAAASDDFDFLEDPVAYPGRAPQPAPPAQADASDARTHAVLPGETLTSISQDCYGSTRWWKLLADSNPNVDPRKLMVGQELQIPPLGGGTGGRVTAKAPSGGAGEERYEIRKGDTLGKIALRFYGSEGGWKRIFDANRPSLSDPAKLTVGTTIRIPR